MTEPETTDQEKPENKKPEFANFNWHVGMFFSSTLLIPSPVFAFLFTPLFPVFIGTFVLPFIILGIAVSACRKHHGGGEIPKGFVRNLYLTMLAGIVLGTPMWFAIVKSIIGGRFL